MKNLIKKLILLQGYLFHHNHNSKVIYYHDISTQYTDMGTDWNLFEKHIGLALQLGFRIVDDITEKINQIQVCFDDGWLGIYEKRQEIIQMGIRPTIFIAVELIGTEGHLSLDQILEMQSMGYNFQGHTWNHCELAPLSHMELRKEIVESKQKLSELLGKEIDSICFPCGVYSDEVIRVSLQAGYKKLYASNNASYCAMEDEGIICRKMFQYLSLSSAKYSLLGDSPFLLTRSLQIHKK